MSVEPVLAREDYGRLDPVTVRLINALSWDWQPLDPVIESLISQVPPGKALRKYQQSYDHMAQKRATENRKPELSDDEKIRSGARAIIYSRATNHTRIEIQMIDGVRQIRWKERRQQRDANDCCVTCHRPFQEARSEAPTPRLQQEPRTVLYPHVPTWVRTLESRMRR